MPLYEYHCSKCGNVFEKLQKFSDDPLTTHEECGGEVVRLISAPGFQFKGSGWYVTDYGRGNSGGSSESGSGDSAKSDGAKSESGKSEGSSESKSKSDSSKSDASGSKPSASKSESTPAAAKSD